MTEINLVLDFIKNYRMNDYFLEQVISELRIGFILTEYLDPDQVSKFKPDENIKSGLISSNSSDQIKAVNILLRIMDIEIKSYDKIIEVLNYSVPIYLENRATEKDKRRRELLLELQTLDASN